MLKLIRIRNVCFIAKQMSLDDTKKILWTHSQCVLNWLKQKENTDIFVNNRVSEITRQNNIIFQSINTNHNPADIPTRDISIPYEILVEDSNDIFPEYSEKVLYEIPGNIPK